MTIKAAQADGDHNLPYQDMLVLLEKDAAEQEQRWRSLFNVLEPLIVDHVTRCDQIDSAVIKIVWETFQRELNPELAAAWSAGHAERTELQQAIASEFTRYRHSDEANKFMLKLGVEKDNQLTAILSLLSRSVEIEDFFAAWPDEITNLDDQYLTPLRDFNELLIEKTPDITPYLLFLVKAHLAKPHEVFRAVERVTRQSTDLIMMDTDMKVVGDALLDQLAGWVEECSWEHRSIPDITKMIGALHHALELISGWTSEFTIDPAGAWGRRLHSLSAELSRQWESHIKSVEKMVTQALPRKRGKATGRQTMPDLDKEIGEQDIVQTENALKLFVEASPYASKGGFTSTRDKVAHFLDAHMEDQEDDLLKLLHDNGTCSGEDISRHFAILRRLTAAYLGDEAAEVISRRGKAAVAAA